MRPKTFPATTYSGNSRQRLQEIREGLKQPSKCSSQGLPMGPNSEASLDAKVLGSKDASRQQQMRATPKFGPYQKALREIRYSLLPFANESGTSAVAEVNRQMLQELVNAGCDQEMAGRALKQTGSRSIEAALEFISKMGYLDPRNEQIVRVIKQTSPGKGLMPTPVAVTRRPSFEGAREGFPAFSPLPSAAYDGAGFCSDSTVVLEEGPRPYAGFLFAGTQLGAPQAYSAHYSRTRPPGPGEPRGYSVQRSPSFQAPGAPPASGLGTPGPAGLYPPPHKPPGLPLHALGPRGSLFPTEPPPGPPAPPRGLHAELYEPWPAAPTRRDSLRTAGPEPRSLAFRPGGPTPSRTHSFSGPQAEPALPAPNTVTAVTAAHILHPVKSVRVLRPEPQTAVGPSHPAWVPAPSTESPATEEDTTHSLAVAFPRDRCPPPPYPKHLLLHSKSEQLDLDGLCTGMEQSLRGSPAEPAAADRSRKGDKGDKAGKDKKQIQTSPVPERRNNRDEEKRESRIKSYSPYAFKFFMEQHVENVIKTYQQKVHRRLQLEQEMAKAGLCEAEQEQMRKILYQKESNYNRLKRAKMDKSMFVKIKTLGIGAFGEVCLACKVDTHALYAMKTLRKKDVLNRNQVAHVKAERDILAEADNEWVVKLYYSFQDKDSLYFVMDYIPGGDMMSLLIRMEVFPEHLARFYIAELTLAIESVHKMGFIHRDIKPDNILIDLDGHIKLTDFGLCTGFRWTHNSKYYQKGEGNHVRQDSMEPSDLWDDVSNCRCGDRLKTLEQRARKQHQRCLAHSLVGTPNYIAPEVLLRKGYTQLCDWWSVGVILFEMLVGQPPFLAPTPTETQLKVINWESTLHIPAQVKLSPEARDLITKLCCSADCRLGRDGADDLKAHPFFSTIDFSSDIRKQPAPYVPTISHPMDTSNFDPVDEESPWNESSEGSAKAWDTLTSPSNKHPEHAFYEFTFRRFFDDNGYPFRCPKPSGAETSHSESSDLESPDLVDQTEGCQPVYV
ncbi:serine/threonine-protein kinase LATS2 [Octodon degus]|uniref:non-specific serine/threonine protein kinase n=1 Tax=Octodon degus TaxID=10160 RepID=A0A6P6D496_OCTDE|nr:serine/threonine-protein kinase LATS2 [Octodon degus]